MEKKKLILTGLLHLSIREEYLHRIESWSYTTDTAGNFSQQPSLCQTPAFKWSFIAPILKFLTPHSGRVSPPQSLSTATPASLQLLLLLLCVTRQKTKQNSSKQKDVCASANASTPTSARQEIFQIMKPFNCVGLSWNSSVTFNIWGSSSDHSYASSLFTGGTALSNTKTKIPLTLKIARQLGNTRADDSHS